MSNKKPKKEYNILSYMPTVMGGFMLLAIMPYILGSTSKGGINGRVYDQGTQAPLAGVTVKLNSSSTITDIDGNYSFSGVAPGSYQLVASLKGYYDMIVDAVVYSGSVITYDLNLARTGEPTGSFGLSIGNVPSGTTYWEAFYRSATYLYGTSGVLGVSQSWSCLYVAGATLTIEIMDSAYNIISIKYDIGPVSEGESFVYDCTTGKLMIREHQG